MPTKHTAPADANLPFVRGISDPDSGQWVEITYKDKVALVAYRDFAGDRASIWSKLAAQDVVLVSRAAKASVSEQVDELEKFSDQVVFARPGWHRGQFATASGEVFAPRGALKGIVGFTPVTGKCLESGTLTGWLEQIALPLVGHHIPCFAIMTCFAAPLLELVQRSDNFGFELAGSGGKGKSTTQRLMASVVGPAMSKDQGYITTFNMTFAALEQSMKEHSDMPFIIDEANLFGAGLGGKADQRAMRDFSFQMGSGKTKGRYGSHMQQGYRFIYVTSANEPFHELLGNAHRDTANAASDRLMSITVPDDDAGVFGELPAAIQSYRQFTQALEKGMGEHFGTAMPKFLRLLVRAYNEAPDKLIAGIRNRVAKFKAHICANENNGSDVRVAEAFGLVYAAGCLARHYKVLPQEWRSLDAAAQCYSNFRSTVPVRQSLPERLLAIAERPETMQIDRHDLPALTEKQMENAGAFIRTVKGEKLLLMTTSFGKLMFPDWGALSKTSEFRALNRADADGRARGYHCRIRSNAKADWFYAFKLPAEP